MKNQIKKLTLCSVVVAAAVVGLATPAFAQDTAPPPAATEAPVRHAARTTGDVGSGGLGIGATMFISGLAGPEVVYDFGLWHLEGMVGFDHRPVNGNANAPSQTAFDFGVGGWYHLHLGASSDFSLGGVFGLLTFSPAAGNSATAFEFEPGAQIRAFITPNVALHAGAGFVFAFGDVVGPLAKQIALDGQVTANFGITYYFR
jgi:hypothetical protein